MLNKRICIFIYIRYYESTATNTCQVNFLVTKLLMFDFFYCCNKLEYKTIFEGHKK